MNSLVAFLFAAAAASLLNVPLAVEAGVGATWSVPGSFSTIQDAIDNAINGDEIVVSPGTYFETIDFTGKDIVVRSVDGPHTTTIDGTGLASTVVTFVSGEPSTARLQGFTIWGGSGRIQPEEGNVLVGGGMVIEDSSPAIDSCIFQDNTARFGGGLWILRSRSIISSCIFRNNMSDSKGGGAYVRQILKANFFNSPDKTEPTFENCLFEDNVAGTYGGGLHAQNFVEFNIHNSEFKGNTAGSGGGGMALFGESGPLIEGCRFKSNEAPAGGGLLTINLSSPTIRSSDFKRNRATGGDIFGDGGGAIFLYNKANSQIVGCTFKKNTSVNVGGAVSCFGRSRPKLKRCNLENNNATLQGGGIYANGVDNDKSKAQIRKTSVCSNNPDDIAGDFVEKGGTGNTVCFSS